MITVHSNSVGTYFASGSEKEDTSGSSLFYIQVEVITSKNIRRAVSLFVGPVARWEVTGIYDLCYFVNTRS